MKKSQGGLQKFTLLLLEQGRLPGGVRGKKRKKIVGVLWNNIEISFFLFLPMPFLFSCR